MVTLDNVWVGYRAVSVVASLLWVAAVVRRDRTGSIVAMPAVAALVWSLLWLLGAFVKPLVLDMELRAY